MQTVRLIGVGNDYRGDDAVGRVVARRLRARTLPGLDVVETSGEGAALMEAWEGAGRVVVVDAARSGAPPGTVHRFEAHREPLPSAFFHYSTHAFSVAEAIELGRVLGRLPASLTVFGIEGSTFEAGNVLSPAVADAARVVEAEIASLVAASVR